MRNFQRLIILWIRTYSEISKPAVYLSYKMTPNGCVLTLNHGESS